MKRFLIAAVAVTAVLALYGCNDVISYFDDPAVKSCRKDLISSLKSPSSYKEIEAKLYDDSAIIEYDAANGFGALIRGTHLCEFTYFGGVFHFTFPVSESNEVKLQNISRWLRLAPDKLDDFPAGDTKLKVSEENLAIEACIKDSAATYAQSATKYFVLPRTDELKVEAKGPNNGYFWVSVVSYEVPEKRTLLVSHSCTVGVKNGKAEVSG